MKQKNLLKQISEMEKKARRQASASVPTPEIKEEKGPEKVDFDSWYFLRSKQIPSHHMKEIIAADFKARNVGKYNTVENFDKALKGYGIDIGKQSV